MTIVLRFGRDARRDLRIVKGRFELKGYCGMMFGDVYYFQSQLRLVQSISVAGAFVHPVVIHGPYIHTVVVVPIAIALCRHSSDMSYHAFR